MSRSMNAEAVFSDLVDVVLKAAREAPTERVAREGYYRMVIGDVAHAVAGLVPVERVCEPVFFTPPFAKEIAEAAARGGHDGEGAVATHRGNDGEGAVATHRGNDGEGAVATHGGKGAYESNMRVARTPETVVFQAALTTGRVVSAELTSCGEAYLYDGGETVCFVKFEDKYAGFGWSYKIIRRALNGLIIKCGKRSRNNVNRRKGWHKPFILTPEQELAETVRRQKEVK